MIIKLIDYVFTFTGRTWKIGGKDMEPTEDDIRKALDKAAEVLYSMKVGEGITVGGLHIIKTRDGQDVYVYVGEYK